jgi:small-conductance mechanosensitive channel
MIIFHQFSAWLSSLSADILAKGLRIALTLILGLLLVRVLAVVTQRYIMRKSTAQRQMIARKVISYSGFVLVALAVLGELGVKLTALLGAAGIVGIAVGFASQTSVSNIISGLFLISEKPFTVGDIIRIGTTTGIIQSIDLLSIKIRTFDNLFVRIPNEKILSSEVTNVTRFPIRRMDILFQVAYGQDLGHIHEVLAETARVNPWSLDEPQPVIIFNDLKESGVEVLYGLWFSQPDFLDLKNSIMKGITTQFGVEGIHFASPNRVIRVVEGSLTA